MLKVYPLLVTCTGERKQQYGAVSDDSSSDDDDKEDKEEIVDDEDQKVDEMKGRKNCVEVWTVEGILGK